ncbi:hypothetical protein [Simplicispira metamorpha]|uniref:hypothetical protein n=1 Tax=Simplicispira metamorpha TaxID=80881 RepID=UPI001404A2CB|nr:hypothetical protein [Simplicispira metamorpha]
MLDQIQASLGFIPDQFGLHLFNVDAFFIKRKPATQHLPRIASQRTKPSARTMAARALHVLPEKIGNQLII